MRHRIKTNRLNRFSSLRKATINSLARAMLINMSIKTTYTKAKAATMVIEHLITLAKRGTLAGKRKAFKILQNHKLVSKLFNEIAALFKNRQSGFTRILKLDKRRGDGAQIVIFELTEQAKKEKKVKKAKKLQRPQETTPPSEEKAYPVIKEKPKEIEKKKAPLKKFLGGLRGFFKKERDSL